MTKHYTSINEHTGALIKSKPNNRAYDEGYVRIFGKKYCPSCGKEVDKSAYETVFYENGWWHEGCWEWEAINLGNIGVGVQDEQEKIIPLVRMPSGKLSINVVVKDSDKEE